MVDVYHWRELPQVSVLSCLSRQTRVLSRQKYACRHKNPSFVTTKICLPRQNFCCDKIKFVATKYFVAEQKRSDILLRHVFVSTKHVFVAKKQQKTTTTCLSQQAYFCRDKRCVLSRQTRVCRDKSKLYVCRDKHTFVATKDYFCLDKKIVATKIILVAAPANDTCPPNQNRGCRVQHRVLQNELSA